MTPQEFQKIVESTLKDCKSILVDRAKMYAKEGDRLSNFKRASKLRNDRFLLQIPIDLVQKQIVALLDDIDEKERSHRDDEVPEQFNMHNIEEWTRDIINYMILIRALCLSYNAELEKSL